MNSARGRSGSISSTDGVYFDGSDFDRSIHYGDNGSFYEPNTSFNLDGHSIYDDDSSNAYDDSNLSLNRSDISLTECRDFGTSLPIGRFNDENSINKSSPTKIAVIKDSKRGSPSDVKRLVKQYVSGGSSNVDRLSTRNVESKPSRSNADNRVSGKHAPVVNKGLGPESTSMPKEGLKERECIRDLTEQLECYKAQLTKKDIDLMKLKTEKEAMADDLNRLSEENKSLVSKLALRDRSNGEADPSSSKNGSSESMYKMRIKEKQERIDHLISENAEKDRRIEKIEDYRFEQDNYIRDLDCKLEMARKDLAKRDEASEIARERVSNLEKTLNEKIVCIDELKKKEREWEDFVSSVNSIIGSSNVGDIASSSAIARITSFIKKQGTMISSLKESARTKDVEHTSQLLDVRSRLQKAQEEAKANRVINDSIIGLQSQLNYLKEQHSVNKSDVAESLKDFKEYSGDMMSTCVLRLRLEMDGHKGKMKQLIDHNDLMKRELKTVSEDKEAKERELLDLRRKGAESSSKLLEDYKLKVTECNALNDNLTRALLDLQQASDGMKTAERMHLDKSAKLKDAEEKYMILRQEYNTIKANLVRVEQLSEEKVLRVEQTCADSYKMVLEESERKLKQASGRLSELSIENDELRKELASFTLLNETAQKECTSKDQELDIARGKLAHLELKLVDEDSRRVQLEEQLALAAEARSNAESRMADAIEALDSMKKEFDKLKHDLDFKTSEFEAQGVKFDYFKSDLNDKIAMKESQIKSLQSSIDEMTSENRTAIESLTNEWQTRFDVIREERDALNVQCVMLTGSLESEKARLLEALADGSEQKGCYDDAVSSLEAALSESRALETLVEDLQSKLAQTELRLAEKESECGICPCQVESMQKHLETLEAELFEKVNLVKSLEMERGSLNNFIEVARNELMSANSDLRSKELVVQTLEMQVKVMEDNSSKLESDLQSEHAEKLKLEEQLKDLDEVATSATKVADRLAKREQKYLATIEKCENNINILKSSCMDLESKCNSLEQEVQDLRSKCSSWNADYDQLLKSKVDKVTLLESICESLRGEIATANEQREQDKTASDNALADYDVRMGALKSSFDVLAAALTQISSKLGVFSEVDSVNLMASDSLDAVLASFHALLEEKNLCDQQISNMNEVNEALGSQVSNLEASLANERDHFAAAMNSKIEEYDILKSRFDSLLEESALHLKSSEHMRARGEEYLEVMEKMHQEMKTMKEHVQELKLCVSKAENENHHLLTKCESWKLDYDKLMKSSTARLSSSDMARKQLAEQHTALTKLYDIARSELDEARSKLAESMRDSIAKMDTVGDAIATEEAEGEATANEQRLAVLISANETLTQNVKDLFELLSSQSEEATVREREHAAYQEEMERRISELTLLNYQLRQREAVVSTGSIANSDDNAAMNVIVVETLSLASSSIDATAATSSEGLVSNADNI